MIATEVLAEYTTDPKGVFHLIDQDPAVRETFCGQSNRVAKGKPPWLMGDETLSGAAATCLPCVLVMKRRRAGVDEWGNAMAQEGIDVCPCGAKYWENDHCQSCGQNWHPSYRGTEEDA